MEALTTYFIDAHHRFFGLFLVSSWLIAALFALRHPRVHLWDRRIWLGSDAWLDARYFLLSAFVKTGLLFPLLLSAQSVALGTLHLLQTLFGHYTPVTGGGINVALAYTVTLFVVGDATRYVLHLAMHRVGFLWRFHRVHHTARRLTPMTFYRVHPIEHLLFGLRYAFFAGIVTGFFVYFFGASLSTVTLLGANIFVFVASLAGSNLRHSHIPLRFGVWERLFVSPAMHQWHHTRQGTHTNFGSILSIWDHLGGTFATPSTHTFRFGLPHLRHTTLKALLFEPFQGKKA